MQYLPQSRLLASQGVAEAYLQTSAALLAAAAAGSQAAGTGPHPGAEGASALPGARICLHAVTGTAAIMWRLARHCHR